MIVKRYWTKTKNIYKTDWVGYFLFGFIPLYIAGSKRYLR